MSMAVARYDGKIIEVNPALGKDHPIDIPDYMQNQQPSSSSTASQDIDVNHPLKKDQAFDIPDKTQNQQPQSSSTASQVTDLNPPPEDDRLFDFPDKTKNQQPPTRPSTSNDKPLRSTSLSLSREDLLFNREQYLSICVPLYKASMTGDWETAKSIFESRPELVRFSITENLETALHVAASAKSTKVVEEFVKNLVSRMTTEDLELRNKNSNTALCLATATGSVKMAAYMVMKNKSLIDIPGSQGMIPLYMAALFGNYEMVLYEMINNFDAIVSGLGSLKMHRG